MRAVVITNGYGDEYDDKKLNDNQVDLEGCRTGPFDEVDLNETATGSLPEEKELAPCIDTGDIMEILAKMKTQPASGPDGWSTGKYMGEASLTWIPKDGVDDQQLEGERAASSGEVPPPNYNMNGRSMTKPPGSQTGVKFLQEQAGQVRAVHVQARGLPVHHRGALPVHATRRPRLRLGMCQMFGGSSEAVLLRLHRLCQHEGGRERGGDG